MAKDTKPVAIRADDIATLAVKVATLRRTRDAELGKIRAAQVAHQQAADELAAAEQEYMRAVQELVESAFIQNAIKPLVPG